jgi:hypothetical protein
MSTENTSRQLRRFGGFVGLGEAAVGHPPTEKETGTLVDCGTDLVP